jgi:glycosyltransferase involved in cell wall biosynthesis
MPMLWERHPSLRLTIAGADPTPSVRALAGGRVCVVGRVDRPDEVLGTHLVHLAPVRFGAGIKLKLIESMACGIPFVTSACGAEGLHLDGVEHLVVADDPLRFCELAEALLTDRARWEHTQAALLDIADRHFSTDAFDASLIALAAELGLAPPSRV